jgi:hypothetical protein
MKRVFLLSLAILALTISIASGLCPYVPGDINGSGTANGIDAVYAVSYFKGGSVPPIRCDMCPQPAPFYAAGDVNGDCVFNGIDIAFWVHRPPDVPLRYCPSCPPN